ncbi:MAG: TonB-dependent receptor plug domain-containing protein, partial [Vicinamibacteria bacterium]
MILRPIRPADHSRRLRTLAAAAAFLVTLQLGAYALAADTPPAQAPAAPTPTPSPTPDLATGVKRAEDLTVTARRKEENIQVVPLAVSVKTGRDLEVAAVADISELQGEVPNLSIYAGRNQQTTLTAFMRGVGQADPLWGVDPGVGLYLDDVYIARPQGALLDVYDVQRIEVLRGPQGTLYGKNTIGGAIKYVSKDLVDKWQGGASYTGGSYSNNDIRANVSGALVEGKLRARLAGG